MRPVQSNMRRRSPWRTVLVAFVAIVIGGAGTVAALAWLRVIDPAKLAFWRSKPGIPAGWIGIPISARPIPAHTAVTREYLLDASGTLQQNYVAPDKVPKGIIIQLSKILDRVTAHDMPGIFYFKESDFLPPGTRPGIAGGTPEGKCAYTLEASKLKGADELQAGDHVDLLVSIPVDMPGAGRSNSGRLGTNVVATPDVALLAKGSVPRQLVRDGVVVTPMKARNVPTMSSSLTQGASVRNVPVREIVLAVEPREVALLAAAINLKYEITCVALSGRPASPGAKHTQSETAGDRQVAMDIAPGFDPMPRIRYMEVMIGPQRQFVLFNGPGNSPVVEPQDDGLGKASPGAAPAGAAQENKP